ncbi:MAG: amino acid adenylation domain-containing protein [Acidobacteriota bacterium]
MTKVTQDAGTEGFRLSFQQRSLWAVQQAAVGEPFQAVCAVAIDGTLRADLVRQSLEHVVTRHEILRSTFQRPSGIKTPFQIVSPRPDLVWQSIDVSGVPADGQQDALDSHVAVERGRTLDLADGPLLRATLFEQAASRHVLLLSVPAICADSRTLTNLITELAAAYESVVNGEPGRSGDPLQYVDFAQWQQELVDGHDEQATAGRAYWNDLATGAAPAPALPLARRAIGAGRFAEAAIDVPLGAELLSKIESTGRLHDTSLSVVLFASWQAVIWRLAGEPDTAFAIHRGCDGRTMEDLQGALGLYAKSLPMRGCCRDESFTDHLRGAIDAWTKTEEWQEFADADSCLESAVSFDFEDRPSAFDRGGLSFSTQQQHVHLRPFTLKLSCVRSGDAVSMTLRYNPRVLDAEVVARYAGYLERFIAAVVTDPARTLGEVNLLGDEERLHLLYDINQTAAAFEGPSCIHELFEVQAARTPDALAVVSGPDHVTYRELNRRANQLAHLLRRRGVKPNVAVGLSIGRSVEMIVGLLGILKAGGAYVPLNAEHPAARLALQLRESQSPVLVTNDGAVEALSGFSGVTVDLARDRALLAAEPQENPLANAASGNLVYVIYTSGSTGVPKGVGVAHRSLVNYTQFMLRRLQVGVPLHFATVSTLSADLGNTSIFPALASGGCLHVLGSEVSMEPALFRKYVAARPIDVLKIVPSHLSTLLVSDTDAAILPAKYLVLGGEALSWELLARITRTAPSCRILNHYGPTETTVGCLTFAVDPSDVPPNSQTVPIGRPIANMRAYILDRRLRPVPTGVLGELYLGGAGVADGYVNQPEETAARFLPDPFVRDASSRIYRTGDLARHLADRSIEFVGRADHQVKVRGYRVELGEIEAVLAATPHVRQAVVVVSGDATSEQQLIAYVAPSAGAALSHEALRAAVREKLPDYMIPSAFVVLPALPLTPNGKVDRAALPAPDRSRPDLQKQFVAPRTAVEQALADIWATVLKRPEVGVHDDFFDLGGHSLLATRVVSQMRRVFQVEIPLGSLFESPTVAALAEEIERFTGGQASRLLADLAELEGLSDEEAASLLDRENGSDS